MNYLINKLVFSCLTSTSLLLSLLSAVHGDKMAIDIEFENGDFVRVGRKGVLGYTTSSPVQMGVGEEINHTPIESILIDIDYAKPFDHLVQELTTKPGIKSATLVTPSPDERCENKIRQFNEISLSSLSFQEKINLHRKFYFSLQKYKEQGSTLAKENLPIVQNNLGVVLACLAQESLEDIPLLRKALWLITISANSKHPEANKNLPIVQNLLGIALARSAQESLKGVPLLREALWLIISSANTGHLKAKENLPIVQNNLGVALLSLSQGSLEGIILLREALRFMTINATDLLSANQDLSIVEYNLGVALTNSAKGSPEEISLRKKALELITSSADNGLSEANKNLPVVRAALERSSQLMKVRGPKRRRTN
jgi:hypothetical protein